MELASINTELREAAQRLRNGSSELFKLAKEKAEAEREYRIALNVQIVKLKDEGERATLIPDRARGMIADKKYDRDLSDARYTAGKELLNSLRAEVSALQSILRNSEEV